MTIEAVPFYLFYVINGCPILCNLLDPSATSHSNAAIFFKILDSAHAHLWIFHCQTPPIPLIPPGMQMLITMNSNVCQCKFYRIKGIGMLTRRRRRGHQAPLGPLWELHREWCHSISKDGVEGEQGYNPTWRVKDSWLALPKIKVIHKKSQAYQWK